MTDTTNPDVLKQICDSLTHEVKDQYLDARVWNEFFNRYTMILKRFARSADCPDQCVEDVICEVWSNVCSNLLKFVKGNEQLLKEGKCPQRFRSWLYIFVRRRTIDEVRKRTRQKRINGETQGPDFWNATVDPQSHENDGLSRLLNQEFFAVL